MKSIERKDYTTHSRIDTLRNLNTELVDYCLYQGVSFPPPPSWNWGKVFIKASPFNKYPITRVLLLTAVRTDQFDPLTLTKIYFYSDESYTPLLYHFKADPQEPSCMVELTSLFDIERNIDHSTFQIGILTDGDCKQIKKVSVDINLQHGRSLQQVGLTKKNLEGGSYHGTVVNFRSRYSINMDEPHGIPAVVNYWMSELVAVSRRA